MEHWYSIFFNGVVEFNNESDFLEFSLLGDPEDKVSSIETSGRQKEMVRNHSTSFWELVSHALMQWEGLGPASTWLAMHCSSPWEACHFLSGDRGGADGERDKWEAKGRKWEERREVKLWLLCKTNENILIRQNRNNLLRRETTTLCNTFASCYVKVNTSKYYLSINLEYVGYHFEKC